MGEDAAIDMYQSDCHLLLADVVGFAQCARNVLAGCQDPVKLNMYIHFAYAFDAYFSHIKSKTPAFGINTLKMCQNDLFHPRCHPST